MLSFLLIHFLPAIINPAPDGILCIFGIQQIHGRQLNSSSLCFNPKRESRVLFIVEEHYGEYLSLADKCLMLYLTNLTLLGVLGHENFVRLFFISVLQFKKLTETVYCI